MLAFIPSSKLHVRFSDTEVSVLGLQRERWKDESVGSFSRV